jgi:hypothetical protein
MALVVLRPSGELPILSRGPKRRDVPMRGHVAIPATFARVLRDSKSGTALALIRAASLVTRSWDATNNLPHISGRRTVPPDTSKQTRVSIETIETRIASSALVAGRVFSAFAVATADPPKLKEPRRVGHARRCYATACFSCAQIA